jgi:VanZ family protein
MYQWQVLFSRGLYQILFAGAFLATLYLLFNMPSGNPPGLINDKVAHAIAFFCLTLLLSRGFPQYYGVKILLAMCVFGLVTELVQYFLPWRTFSIADWLADIAGVLCYHCLHLIRKRFVKLTRADDHV